MTIVWVITNGLTFTLTRRELLNYRPRTALLGAGGDCPSGFHSAPPPTARRIPAPCRISTAPRFPLPAGHPLGRRVGWEAVEQSLLHPTPYCAATRTFSRNRVGETKSLSERRKKRIKRKEEVSRSTQGCSSQRFHPQSRESPDPGPRLRYRHLGPQHRKCVGPPCLHLSCPWAGLDPRDSHPRWPLAFRPRIQKITLHNSL